MGDPPFLATVIRERWDAFDEVNDGAGRFAQHAQPETDGTIVKYGLFLTILA